jgi:hypothetical protein
MGALGAGGGALVVEATSESLAQGIRALAHADRAELTAMGRAGAIVAETFRWSRAATTLLEAYRRPDGAAPFLDAGTPPSQLQTLLS